MRKRRSRCSLGELSQLEEVVRMDALCVPDVLGKQRNLENLGGSKPKESVIAIIRADS